MLHSVVLHTDPETVPCRRLDRETLAPNGFQVKKWFRSGGMTSRLSAYPAEMILRPEVDRPTPAWFEWLLAAIVLGCISGPYLVVYAFARLVDMPDWKPRARPAVTSSSDARSAGGDRSSP